MPGEIIKICPLSGEPVIVRENGKCDCAQVDICMAALFILADTEVEEAKPAKASTPKNQAPPVIVRSGNKPHTSGFAGNRGRARY